MPTHTFETAPRDLEVLFVPGGKGVEAGEEVINPILDFISERNPELSYLLSVCTGAALLARAGVLDGRNATTNKVSLRYLHPLIKLADSPSQPSARSPRSARKSTGLRMRDGWMMAISGRARESRPESI